MRLVAAACAICACAHGAPPSAQLAGWTSGHPAAASELCAFAQQYPSDATRLRLWARSHPAQAGQLLDMAAETGAWQASAFLGSQRDWDGYSPGRDPALFALLDWAWDRPEAAHDLAGTPHGLERAMEGRSCAREQP